MTVAFPRHGKINVNTQYLRARTYLCQGEWMARSAGTEPDAELGQQVAAVMHAAQTLVGIAVSSLSEVQDVISLPQLRILVLVAGRGPLNVNAVAAAAGVHPSNASRACEPLVARGLLTRRASAADRRQVELVVTEQGRDVLSSVLRRRQSTIAEILGRMPPGRREGLVHALEDFASAAEEVVPDDLWQWTPPIE